MIYTCILRKTEDTRLIGKHNFLDRESKYYGRKIKEALYINAFDPNDDLEELMNIEKGANVNQCWREFNEQVKGTCLKMGI